MADNAKIRIRMSNHNFLFLSILIAAIYFPVPAQERWVPDYSNRDAWQQPEKIMDAIGVKSGMVVADVGAGEGYFTFKLAERVGPGGKVFATDIEERPLAIINDRRQREGIENIVTIFGKSDDPGLPKGKIDLVLMVHVFHLVIHGQDPLALLENIRASLGPQGLLVLVHLNGNKMGYPEVYAYSKESVLMAIKNSSFELIRIETFLPRDDIYILRAKQR
jgi:ubiquinone/menaquinone biosynthesis C-methylase UbiE